MPIFGRNPEPSHYFAVEVRDESGRVIQRCNLSALPPIGYKFVGREVIGGEITRAQMSDANTSVNLAKATVIVR